MPEGGEKPKNTALQAPDGCGLRSVVAARRLNTCKVQGLLINRSTERALAMSRMNSLFFAASATTLLLLLPACSPTLNWRDVRPEGTGLVLLLPCKPDKAEKTVPLGGKPTMLKMLGCNAAGATFAVAMADIGDAAAAASVLAQWQALTLANMKAPPLEGGGGAVGGAVAAASAAAGSQSTQVAALKLPGAAPQPSPVLIKARGQRADGTAAAGNAAYFAQGSQLFQVVLYADKIAPEVSETFFSSIRFE